jgi:hypothetical protein
MDRRVTHDPTLANLSHTSLKLRLDQGDDPCPRNEQGNGSW